MVEWKRNIERSYFIFREWESENEELKASLEIMRIHFRTQRDMNEVQMEKVEQLRSWAKDACKILNDKYDLHLHDYRK